MVYLVLIIGFIFLISGIIPLTAFFIFYYCPGQTAKACAILRKTKYKKNMIVRDSGSRRRRLEKHYTMGTYIYVVDKKAYKCKDSLFGTPKQAAYSLPIVYIKRFPRFYYINQENDLGKGKYILYSIFPLVMSVLYIILGLAIL